MGPAQDKKPSGIPPDLERGDSAPWFRASALSGSPAYAFDTVAGRHVLMLFFKSAAEETAAQALALVAQNRALFDDTAACFFGVTANPDDASAGRIAQHLPGIRFFLDYDRKIAALYRAADDNAYRAQWVVLDPALRILGVFTINDGEGALALLRSAILAAPKDEWAPVLMVPNVLSPDMCAELLRGYEANGGEESGFMRDIDGKTVLVVDQEHKQRRDWAIEDEHLRQRLLRMINRHLTVPIKRSFQFQPTRIERYLVACYEAGAGHFRPHRDNTTRGTAHRRFAITINLNADDYEGGDLRFPEFGQRTYRAPTGGAIVFSCSLLHEATPVSKGRRFAFLPFLYDEEAAALREANNLHLGDSVGAYSRWSTGAGGLKSRNSPAQ